MNKKVFVILISFLSIAAVGVLGYVLYNSNEDESAGDGKVKIATTIFPSYDIASNIAGEKVGVVNVLPSGASPHTFEPTIQSRAEIEDADLVFVIGQELDHWVEEIADEEKIVDLSENIDLIKFEEEHEHEEAEEHEEHEEHEEEGDDHEDEHEHEHEHSEYDPHYWLDPVNGKIMAQAIFDELVALDSQNEDYYSANLEEFEKEVDLLINESNQKMDQLTESERKIVTFHNAFNYFANRFDLEVVATVEEFPGKEPSIAYVDELITTLEEYEVKKIYTEPQLSDTLVETLSQDYDISVAILDPLGGTESRQSYIELISFNVDSIRDN